MSVVGISLAIIFHFLYGIKGDMMSLVYHHLLTMLVNLQHQIFFASEHSPTN